MERVLIGNFSALAIPLEPLYRLARPPPWPNRHLEF